jgi:hypothetical protein
MTTRIPAVVSAADDAREAIRTINHATITTANPAPVVYEVLGSLKLLGGGLDQALSQLGSGLGRSLDLFDVYQDDGSDPAVHIAEALDYLMHARRHALQMGALLERAQGAISRQGYRADEPEQAADPVCGCDSPAEPHGQSFHITPQTQDTARRRAAELANESDDEPGDG